MANLYRAGVIPAGFLTPFRDGLRRHSQALNGTDSLRLVVCENDETGQVLLAAVFDNLGKGAAGAAVQNLDLMVAGT